MSKKKFKIYERKEFLWKTCIAAKEVSTQVGSTMTAIGEYKTLTNGQSTNDGATIVKNFAESPDHPVMKHYFDKLNMATSKTDELAGDGTSATTILTNALLEKVTNQLYDGDVNPNKVVFNLKKLKEESLKYLDDNKLPLNTKKDYINLATVSTKDDELGKLIGEAFYKGGKNAFVNIRASKKKEDWVEYEKAFYIPATNVGLNIPTDMEDAEVIIVKGEINRQNEFLKQMINYTFGNKKKVLIISEGYGEIGLRTITSANETNTDGSLTVIGLPKELHANFTIDELLEDISAYVNTKVHSQDSFETKFRVEDVKFGKVKEFAADKEGSKISVSTTDVHVEDRVKVLKTELTKLTKEGVNIERIKVLKSRLNMLEGTTVFLHIFGNNKSEFDTKLFSVEDAVKATRYTLAYGFVPGAGVFYRNMSRSLTSEYKDVFNVIEKNIMNIIGEESISFGELEHGIVIDKHTGEYVIKDVIESGIIDSAKVVENVITNSITIAIEIARTGSFYTVEEEDE